MQEHRNTATPRKSRCGECGKQGEPEWIRWSYQFELTLCLDCYERRYRSTQRTPVR